MTYSPHIPGTNVALDGRTRPARRLRELEAAYLGILGNPRSPVLRTQIRAVAELQVMIENARAQAIAAGTLSHKGKIGMGTLEASLERKMLQLGLITEPERLTATERAEARAERELKELNGGRANSF
jgi:hypothetical protein